MNPLEDLSVYDLLVKKHEVVSEMLRVSKLVDMSVNIQNLEKEVSDYYYLLEKREPMFVKIHEIETELKQKGFINLDNLDKVNEDNCKQATELFTHTNQMVSEIIEIDTKNNTAASKILDLVKGNLKSINLSRNAANRYQTDSDSSRFSYDEKK